MAVHTPTGDVVGTITGVDHVAVFDDPQGGSSLWCLTVDMNAAPPGTGQALLAALAARLMALGRRFVDLSVLADNTGAIRLYERLGFARTADLFVKRKNPINEELFVAPGTHGHDELNPYAKIIAVEARRRGIGVEIIDAEWGEMRLTHGGRRITMRESLSELTSAVAMSRCDDKRVTRRVLARAGLRVPRGADATRGGDDVAFMHEVGSVVVKPARGEQGRGITVGVTTEAALEDAVALATRHCADVLLEEHCPGQDLRVVVIDHAVVAAAVRRPASVTGDGRKDVRALIEAQSRRRAAATGGESTIPLDAATEEVVREAGWELDDVPPSGEHDRRATDRQPAHRRDDPRRHGRAAPRARRRVRGRQPGARDPGHRARPARTRPRGARARLHRGQRATRARQPRAATDGRELPRPALPRDARRPPALGARGGLHLTSSGTVPPDPRGGPWLHADRPRRAA